MLTRVARACAAREAAALRPAVLESARGQFGMCTEAFVGFSGARPDQATDAVPRDGAESTSDYPASARPRDASSSASRLSAGPWTAAATPPSDTNTRADIWRARIGGSGIDGFDRAWRKPRDSRGYAAETRREDWERLRGAGEVINPCNSPKHPAAVAGIPLSGEPQQSIQASYDKHSQCFVCGNAHSAGLGLKSLREDDERVLARNPSALRSSVVVGDAHQGLPGIVSTGIMDALMICHGSWQAGIALMDRAVLPRPPLVLTKQFSMTVFDRLPPGQEIEIRTTEVDVSDSKEPYRVRVRMELTAAGDADHLGNDFVCASGEAMYEKVGAVRSMW